MMKKVIFLLVLVAIAVASTVVLTSCSEEPPTACTECVDKNTDGKCDECGNAVAKPECTECKDENSDGNCDECGKPVAKQECDKCTDANTDGVCEVCGKEVPVTNLVLLKDGKINFTFVASDTLPEAQTTALTELVLLLKSLGIEATAHRENESHNAAVEVLVGNVASRGEQYLTADRSLGYSGYFIKLIDGKCVIFAGSDEAMNEALEKFRYDVLGFSFDESDPLPTDAKLSASNEIFAPQDDYKITDVTVGGQSIRNHVIAYDDTNAENLKLAKTVQNYLYRYTGIWLDIVPASDVGNRSAILFASAEKSGGEGFYIEVEGTNLKVISEFYNKTFEEGDAYFKQKLMLGRGEVALTEKTVNVRDVNYEMFGAKGDGKTDDSDAIREAHAYANAFGHTVNLNYNKKYYIPKISTSIVIKTDVFFQDAEFIIDDRDIGSTDPLRSLNVFVVSSDYSSTTLYENDIRIHAINEAGGIDASECKKLDLGLGYPALLKVTNSYHVNYIRYGANKNDGSSQMEVVLIDAEGNIDPDTPFMFDYEQVTSIQVIRTDVKQITLDGGHFITRANQATSDYKYYGRNMNIARSNTVVKNLKYSITDERPGKYEGDPYSAFLAVSNANNVLITDCSISAHKTYYSMGSGGSEVGMGTYGISANNSNKVTWLRCVQPNFYKEDGVTPSTGYWGIMGSSYSKNLAYVDSTLSRFDAHAGVYNSKIINSNVVHFRIVGSGEMLIENSHIYNNLLIGLREDYGAFWHGNITIKDVTMHNSGDVNLLGGTWYSHDFGYPTAHPTEITIDNLTLTKPATVNIFTSAFIEQSALILEDTVNRTTPTRKVTIKNNANGYKFVVPNKKYYTFFSETEFVFE